MVVVGLASGTARRIPGATTDRPLIHCPYLLLDVTDKCSPGYSESSSPKTTITRPRGTYPPYKKKKNTGRKLFLKKTTIYCICVCVKNDGRALVLVDDTAGTTGTTIRTLDTFVNRIWQMFRDPGYNNNSVRRRRYKNWYSTRKNRSMCELHRTQA